MAALARNIVIFTGRYDAPSAIEDVDEIAHHFPHWRLLVLQEQPARAWWSYLRSKVRRLAREPISYPLEILAQMGAAFHLTAPQPVTGNVAALRCWRDLRRPNVKYRSCGSFADAQVRADVRRFAPWLGVALAAPRLMPDLYSLPQLGTVNLHKSLLPDYRGMPPAFWELFDGTERTGATVHWVDEGLDTGPMVHQEALAIPPNATIAGLSAQLDGTGTRALIEALRKIDAGETIGFAQNLAPAARSRPSWLTRWRLQRTLRKRRAISASPRGAAKLIVLTAYVYLWAPVRNLVRSVLKRSHVTILLYHRVNDEHLDSVTVGIEQFRRQLAVLRRHYHVIDLRTFIAGCDRGRRRPAVVVTFDDGYADNLVAARLLRRAGVPATFFLSTRMIDGGPPFEHDLHMYGHALPTLTWKQVNTMARWGFDFGNHTAHHLNLAHVPRQQALAQIEIAASDLRAHVPAERRIDALAYPYGLSTDMSDAVRDALNTVSTSSCLSGDGGVNQPPLSPLKLHRQAVDHKFSLLAFRAALEGWSWSNPRRAEQLARSRPRELAAAGNEETSLLPG